MDEAEQILYRAKLKDEEGRFDDALDLYQQGLEKMLEKLKRRYLPSASSPKSDNRDHSRADVRFVTDEETGNRGGVHVASGGTETKKEQR